MRLSRASTIALFVALIFIAGVVPAPAIQVAPASPSDTSIRSLQVAANNVSVGGTEWQLGLNENGTPRVSTARIGIDVAGVVNTQYGSTNTQLARHTLQVRLDTANSDDERFAILEAASERTETRLADLEALEHTVVRRYAAGSIATSEYLDRVTRIDQETRALLALIEVIDSAGSEIRAAEISRQVESLRARAQVLLWPVRDRITATQVGQREAFRIHVVATQNGVVMSAIVDEEFIREARRYDRRPTTGAGSDLQISLDRITAVYPVAVANMNAISVGGNPNAMVFYATIETQDNTAITSYIDNRNLLIFKEVYRQSVTEVQPTARIQTSNSDLTLSVERTLTGGPMRVRIQDSGSTEPIDATITFNGTRVGATGADGELWVIDPGGSFDITAQSSPGTSVSLTTRGPERRNSTVT